MPELPLASVVHSVHCLLSLAVACKFIVSSDVWSCGKERKVSFYGGGGRSCLGYLSSLTSPSFVECG